MTTFAYVRVLTQIQTDHGISLRTQQEKIAAYAKLNDLDIDHIFMESAVSGGVPLAKRPEGQKLMARLKPHDVVICVRLDRIFRSNLDALQTAELFRKKKCELHLLDMNGNILGNGTSQLFFSMLSALGQWERQLIGERIRESKASMRQRGIHQGGKYTPFGFKIGKDKKLMKVPEEQKAIRAMVRYRKKGKSWQRIVEEIEQRYGYSLSLSGVKKMVLRNNPELAGWYRGQSNKSKAA